MTFQKKYILDTNWIVLEEPEVEKSAIKEASSPLSRKLVELFSKVKSLDGITEYRCFCFLASYIEEKYVKKSLYWDRLDEIKRLKEIKKKWEVYKTFNFPTDFPKPCEHSVFCEYCFEVLKPESLSTGCGIENLPNPKSHSCLKE